MCLSTSKLGIENRVFTLTKNNAPDFVEIDKIVVRRIPSILDIASTPLSISAFPEFNKEATKADIIHFHFPWPLMDLMQAISWHGKPYLVSYHSDIIKQKKLLLFYQPIMRQFLGNAHAITVATSSYMKSSPVLSKLKSKTHILPYGLEESSYPAINVSMIENWKNRIGKRFFLFVGVLRYYKGLHILLDALQGLDYPVAIVGDGPEKDRLSGQAARLGLKNCHFLGRLDDQSVAGLYEACECFVFPSHLRSEAFGMALLEAAMYGKPLISFEIGSGMSEINLDGISGLSVKPNSTSLREAMMKMWSNPELREEFGISARSHFEKNFTSENMGKNLSAIYENILKPH